MSSACLKQVFVDDGWPFGACALVAGHAGDCDLCPGEGNCHGCLAWCVHCGDVSRMCDAMRCDKHRCRECNEIRPPETREFWDYVCDVCNGDVVDPADPLHGRDSGDEQAEAGP